MAAWRRTAEVFNEISAKVRPHGFYVGYHNHHTEFQPKDGEIPWDVFFDNTVPEVVMQVDTGNMMHGNGDPVHYLRKYPGRALTVHLKEYSATNDKAVIGEGDCPWAEIFDLCETVGGTEWYIVEQESYAYPPLECVKVCLDNLRAMGK
ncbi:MAG: sugar phosphate isomerase/epimerase family protein [Armatimonadota bacterium]